jgi:hypothetical protein
MLPWDISQRCNPTQAKRPSVPLVNLDRSGRVKADTLEFFATKPGWHSPSDLRVDPVLGAIYPRFPDNKSIQMRLMRYSRLGILKRRRAGRKYFYSITQAGKKRLVYFWEKLGYLDQANATTEKERNLFDARLEVAISIVSEINMDVRIRLITES